MSYINHINKYADAQAIQDALDAGTLANPYVAMTSAGTLDYNTLSPTPPAPQVYVQDTDGNTYYPTENEGEYHFSFDMDPEAGIQLFTGSEPAIAEGGFIEFHEVCDENEDYTTVYVAYPPIDFSTPLNYPMGYTVPEKHVDFTFTYSPGVTTYITGAIETQYCSGGSTSSS